MKIRFEIFVSIHNKIQKRFHENIIKTKDSRQIIEL